eukprot:gene20516-24627_t
MAFIQAPGSVATVTTKHLLLCARAKIELSDWDACQTLLCEDDETMRLQYRLLATLDAKELSLISMLRARVYDALDVPKKAKYWYVKALKADYHNYEAFEALTKNHMLSYKEELELLAMLPFVQEDQWLRDLYSLSLKKYDVPSRALALPASITRSNDVRTSAAEHAFTTYQYKEAYDITKRILKEDKYYNNQTCLMVHLSSMYELQMKNELFYTCHQLMEAATMPAVAWYGIACYYHLTGNSEMTQRAFTKATSIDGKLGAAWLGFGHFFANKGEHDQAMAAYRTAARLLTGLHLPPLCIGMELVRVHNLNLAEQYLHQARDICPYDPLIYNELGVIAFKNQEYKTAVQFFKRSLEKKIQYKAAMEPTIYNLAHCYRKLRAFDEAIEYYQIAQTLSPNNASIFTAMGYTHHLQGAFDEAIDLYHQSLSIRDDTFTNTLLHKALSLSILKHE